MKLAFLLRNETGVAETSAFYDFVPYKYGPFSFALYRELSSLSKDGYLMHEADTVSLLPKTRSLVEGKTGELPQDVRVASVLVLRKYGVMPQRELLKCVYERYPWYATKSVLKDLIPANLPESPKAPPAVYSMGYEARSVDSFFDTLLRRGLRQIVDVRANPVSRKYGFASSTLAAVAAKLGLRYVHFPELGIPSANRASLSDLASYQKLLSIYAATTLLAEAHRVTELGKHISCSPSVLVCMERDVRYCHRGPLARALAESTGLGVVHL
jgi:uncharacterized protein (DUF488 family)